MKRAMDRAFLAVAGAVPKRVASHLLFLLRQNPSLADAWGYHIRPIHYYDPLPDFARISPAQARRRRLSPVVDFRATEQTALVQRLGAAIGSEIREISEASRFDFVNEYFSRFDAALYYALLRDLKPKRVIEIGSGFSSQIAALALARNRSEGIESSLTCIEPYPEPRLLSAGLDMVLLQQRVEDVPLPTFDVLESNDVLFIDSSHAVRYGGDVLREILEIIPALKPGVWIHVHDVFFPYDYPVDWLVEKRLAFGEQYLLEAFLAFNHSFSVQVGAHWLTVEHPDVAATLWAYDCSSGAGSSIGCGSFWMRRDS